MRGKIIFLKEEENFLETPEALQTLFFSDSTGVCRAENKRD
jgi:hypothetical protein